MAAVVLAVAGGPVQEQTTGSRSTGPGMTPALNPAPAGSSNAMGAFGRLPLSFEANAGQAEPGTRFLARAPGGSYAFDPSGVTVFLPAPRQARLGSAPISAPGSVHLNYLGAGAATSVSAGQPLPGRVNYLVGERKSWITNLPSYRGIRYSSLYPGVSLDYEGPSGSLKGTYTVLPQADPSLIHWRYDGAAGVTAGPAGDLQIGLVRTGAVPAPLLTEHAPVAWQEVLGHHRAVAVHYALERDGSIRFALGAYDRSRSLVIDPSLTYSTYVGGGDPKYIDVKGVGIAVDGTGSAYVTGGLPPVAQQVNPLAFVSKLNPSGSAIEYTTYFGRGGEGTDAIAVDGAGDAYAAGISWDTGFPVINGLGGCSGTPDSPMGLLLKLDPSGANLLYSTCIGGANPIRALTVDGSGHAYLTGTTTGGLPTTAGAFQTVSTGQSDAFVVKLDTTSFGSASLVYSTLLGGEGADSGNGIAVDPAGDAFVTGSTASQRFPVTGSPPNLGNQPFQASNRGNQSAFVTRLNPAGSALIYSTYLGGSGDTQGNAIAINASGNAYVTGSTYRSPTPGGNDFPVQGAFQASSPGNSDAFVSELSASGSSLVYSTYLGGSDDDEGRAIGVVPSGEIYVSGETISNDFPTAENFAPLNRGASSGAIDAFVAKLTPSPAGSGSQLIYSTFLGGGDHEAVAGMALWTDPSSAHSAYVVGTTSSADFPTAPAVAEQASMSPGGAVRNAFLSRIGDATGPPTIAVLDGANSSAAVGTAFTTPLRAAARPGNDYPTPGLPVTFSAPGSGASGSFGTLAGCTTITAISVTCSTDSHGVVTAPVFTANGTMGSYAVVAHLAGASPDAVFALTNSPIITIDPPSIDFDPQPLGATSASRSLTLTNSGPSAVTITAVTAAPGDFGETSDCGPTLQSEAHCMVNLSFTPNGTGPRWGTLSVTYGAVGSPATVALSGSGTAAGAACSATPLPAGLAVAWGRNNSGQTGIGDVSPWRPASISDPGDPSRLGTLTGAVGLAAGLSHSLVLTSDGSVFAFGDNSSGQLGTGLPTGTNVPTPVSGLGPGSGVTVVAAGGAHSLALRSDGSVLTWGSNAGGQLGNGSTADSIVPAPVVGLGPGSGVIALAGGDGHSLALKADGTVLAWGADANGELGNGSTSGTDVPVAVSGLGAGSGVIAVAAGGASSYALRSDGTVLAWGRNANGELGNGSTSDSNAPVGVQGLGAGSGVTAVSSGADFSLALRSNGSVLAWGANSLGQLGDGSTIDRHVPVPVNGLGPAGATAIVAATYPSEPGHGDYSLALLGDGTALAWGDNEDGEFGNGTSATNSTVPVSGPFGPHSGVSAITSHLAIIGRARGSITVTSGSGQSVPSGTALSPVRFTLRDRTGQPVSGAPVTLANETALTDGDGVATLHPHAGAPGPQTLIAFSPGFGNAMVTWTALPIDTTAVGGTPQTAMAGSTYPVPLRALVTAGGRPLPSYPVDFRAASFPGTFIGGGTSVRVLTDAGGVATAPAVSTSSTDVLAVKPPSTYSDSNTIEAGAVGGGSDASFSLTIAAGPVVITAMAGTPQRASAGSVFAAPLQARLTAGSQPLSGVPVTFSAPTGGASGTFVTSGGDSPTYAAHTDANGLVTSVPFRANASSGDYSVTANAPGAMPAAAFAMTNAPRTITPGPGQAAAVGATFEPLRALVTAGASPVAGATVTFTAPAGAPSGVFAGGGATATAVTDSKGMATAPAFTATSQPGPYTLTASGANAASAQFALTNLPPNLGVCDGTPQSAPLGAAFGVPLRAVLTDVGNHPVAGATVTFTAPSGGATATFPGGATAATATTNASGIATAPNLTANTTPGSFTVVAGAPGAAIGARYALSNNSAHTLTVTRAGAGSGSVSSRPPGISCGSICSAPFGSGAGVNLIATPASGSSFAGWSGGCSGTAACSLTMDADRSATATFVILPDLSLDMSHSPATFIQGSSGTYTLTAANVGGAPSSGTVTVSDTLPGGLTPTAATGTGWACSRNGQQVSCSRADVLAAGAAYPNITISVAVAPNAGSVTNLAIVSGGGEVNAANDTIGDPTPIAAGPPPAPAATLSPSSLSFGGQAVGSTSAPRNVTLTNTGTAPLSLPLGSISTSLPDYLQTNTCRASLEPGTGCTISVSFSPSKATSRPALLSVSDNAAGSPQTISLSGSGLPVLSGDASAIHVSGLTLLSVATVLKLPDSGLGLCEAGPLVTASPTTITGSGLPGCQTQASLPNPTGGSLPLLSLSGAAESVTTSAGGSASARSTAASLSLLPGMGLGGADVLDVTGLDSQASASCSGSVRGTPTGSSSIAALSISGTRVATQPVGSRLVLNPTGKNPIILYGNPTSINPTGARVPMAVVTLNYSRYDPATNTRVSSPLVVDFPAGGALSSIIVGRVFVSYASSGALGCS